MKSVGPSEQLHLGHGYVHVMQPRMIWASPAATTRGRRRAARRSPRPGHGWSPPPHAPGPIFQPGPPRRSVRAAATGPPPEDHSAAQGLRPKPVAMPPRSGLQPRHLTGRGPALPRPSRGREEIPRHRRRPPVIVPWCPPAPTEGEEGGDGGPAARVWSATRVARDGGDAGLQGLRVPGVCSNVPSLHESLCTVNGTLKGIK